MADRSTEPDPPAARPRPRPAPSATGPADPEGAGRHRHAEADNADPLPTWDADDPESFYEQLYIAQRRAPRKASRLPRLLRDAFVLVWRTSRLATTAILATQIFAAALAALQVLLAGLIAQRFLEIQPGDSLNNVLWPLALLLVATFVSSVTGAGQGQLGVLLSLRAEREVTDRVLDVSTSVELITFEDAKFYDQLSRIMATVVTRPYSVVTCIASLVGGLAGFGAVSVTLLFLQPVLLPIVLLSGIPLWFLSRRRGRMEFEFSIATTPKNRERLYMTDLLTNRESAPEVRAYGTAKPLRTRHGQLFLDYIEATRKQVGRRYRLAITTALATTAVLGIAFAAVAILVETDQISIAQGAAAAVAVRLLGSRIQQLFGGVGTLFESGLFLRDYEEFMTRRPHATATEVLPGPSTAFRGAQLQDVSFRYPGAGTDALHSVSVDVTPGEVIALVGENGSGKTTLAKILAGLYSPTSGKVVWNGRPLTSESQHDVRDSVALLLQDFTHYALSLRENIALGRPEAEENLDRVVAAAKHVGADSFVSSLPDGYDTRLSRMFDGGRELSLGQWQRVALARAFYRDAPVVILDEPTAALDPRAERHLFDSVRRVMHGRTVVLITHRLASIRGADRILVLERGRLVEHGGHEALMQQQGLYAELVELQQSGALDGVRNVGG